MYKNADLEELTAAKVRSIINQYHHFKDKLPAESAVQLVVMTDGRTFEMEVSSISHTEDGLIIFINAVNDKKSEFIQHVSQFDRLSFLFTEIKPESTGKRSPGFHP